MRKRIIIAAVFIGLYTLLRFLPAIIGKNYLLENDHELLGRNVEIESLDVNLFTGEIELQGFQIQETNNLSPFVALDTFYVNFRLYKLLNNTVYTDKLLVAGLSVNITQKDSVFNFSDILNHFATSDTLNTSEQDTSTSTIKYSFHNLAIRNSELQYTDLSRDNTIEMVDLNLALPKVEWNNSTTSADLNFDLGKGGKVSLAGDLNSSNSDFDMRLSVANFNLEITEPYLHDFINFERISGLASTSLHFTGNIEDYKNIKAKGELSVLDFSLNDSASTPLAQFEKFYTNIPTYSIKGEGIHIDTLLLSKPSIRFDVKDSLHNFSHFVKTTPADSSSIVAVDSTEKDTNSISYSIEHLRILNAGLFYNDYNYEKKYHYEINKVNIVADSLYSNTEEWNFDIDGKMNDTGYVKAEIAINPLNFSDMQVNYSVENFQFHDLSILSKHYAGYPIHKGSMVYFGNVRLVNDSIYSQHKIKISHLEFGKKEKANPLYDIPLRIGIYLMTDANGNIVLDLPVNGNINDPDFRIGKIVWGIVKNTIGKVAKAPYKALAGLVSTDPENLKDITFEFGDTILSDKAIRTLELLDKVHHKKPNLEFLLVQYVDDATEQEVIALNQCKTDYRLAKQLDPKTNINTNNPEFLVYLQKRNDLVGDTTLTSLDLCLKTIDPETLRQQQVSMKAARKVVIENNMQVFNPELKRGFKTQDSKPLHERNVGSKPTFDINFEMKQ